MTCNRFRRWLVLAAILILPGIIHAQIRPFVLLEKAGTKKKFRYYRGDEIKFTLRESKGKKSGVITSFNDSIVFLQSGVGVAYDEIGRIHRPRNGVVKGIGSKALVAIPLIIGFSAANNLFNTGDTPIVDDGAWNVSGVFAAIWLVSLTVGPDKDYKLKNRWRLVPVIH